MGVYACVSTVSGMPHKFDCVTAKNSSNPPPKPIRSQSTISHQPREFLLCLMQISHVLLLFISLHYLDSAKCHVMLISYYLSSAAGKLRMHIKGYS